MRVVQGAQVVLLISILLLWQFSFAQGIEEEVEWEAEPLTKDDCSLCHSNQVDAFFISHHGRTSKPEDEGSLEACQACHGDFQRHLDEHGETLDGVTSFIRKNTPASERNQICLNCHQDGGRIHWPGSEHDTHSMDCSSCHRIHARDTVMSRSEESRVCFSCHQQVRADMHKPSGHPSGEAMSCRDCHDSHGSIGNDLLNNFDVNLVCYDCHADLRGPFLWEHPPASDDCLTCHEAHGSIHSSMLKWRAPFLCQQCHQNEIGTRHYKRVMDLNSLVDEGQGRFIVAGSCMNCHPKVHGSNHPSGMGLSR